jgi:triose/dihydroxyacetone kinase / FAD-AMP lyase (cyclizing)
MLRLCVCSCVQVAGAVAALGADVSTVAEAARKAARSVSTIGASLSTCTVPGCPPPAPLAEGMVELGLGIHGEAGATRTNFTCVDELVTTLIDRVRHAEGRALAAGDRVAVIVNNLGAVTPMEMMVVAKQALKLLAGSTPSSCVSRWQGCCTFS